MILPGGLTFHNPFRLRLTFHNPFRLRSTFHNPFRLRLTFHNPFRLRLTLRSQIPYNFVDDPLSNVSSDGSLDPYFFNYLTYSNNCKFNFTFFNIFISLPPPILVFPWVGAEGYFFILICTPALDYVSVQCTCVHCVHCVCFRVQSQLCLPTDGRVVSSS